MRAEIVDVNRSVNVSRQLHEQQETAGQLQLTRSDVTALQMASADASAHQNQLNQSVEQMAQQVQRLEGQQRNSAAHLERLESNVSNPFRKFFFLQYASPINIKKQQVENGKGRILAKKKKKTGGSLLMLAGHALRCCCASKSFRNGRLGPWSSLSLSSLH